MSGVEVVVRMSLALRVEHCHPRLESFILTIYLYLNNDLHIF